ncbi:MAG: hypothetical protein ABI045_04850 [Flavobacteriales bacterium]
MLDLGLVGGKETETDDRHSLYIFGLAVLRTQLWDKNPLRIIHK